MSIDGERELRQRLGQALDGMTPRPAPVAAAVRQGGLIRVRRRLTAAAGVAAVAAAAIAIPALLHALPQQHAVTPQPRHTAVTVHPPGPHAPAGLIAWGTIGRRHWGIRADRPGAAGSGRGNQCVTALGAQNCGEPMTMSGYTGPASLAGVSSGAAAAEYGAVAPDVSYLKVSLTGGRALTLHPVRVYGVRVAGFAAPASEIAAISAYSRQGLIATAVAFHGPHQMFTTGDWLRPGQPGLPRVTRLIGSGTTDGTAWSVTLYQGPWGRCLVTGERGEFTSGCNPGGVVPGTRVSGVSAGNPRILFGTASPAVRHVVITLAGHPAVRVATVAAGNYRYFAAAVSGSAKPRRWTAYDAARHAVASGSVY